MQFLNDIEILKQKKPASFKKRAGSFFYCKLLHYCFDPVYVQVLVMLLIEVTMARLSV